MAKCGQMLGINDLSETWDLISFFLRAFVWCASKWMNLMAASSWMQNEVSQKLRKKIFHILGLSGFVHNLFSVSWVLIFKVMEEESLWRGAIVARFCVLCWNLELEFLKTSIHVLNFCVRNWLVWPQLGT